MSNYTKEQELKDWGFNRYLQNVMKPFPEGSIYYKIDMSKLLEFWGPPLTESIEIRDELYKSYETQEIIVLPNGKACIDYCEPETVINVFPCLIDLLKHMDVASECLYIKE